MFTNKTMLTEWKSNFDSVQEGKWDAKYIEGYTRSITKFKIIYIAENRYE